MRPPPLRPEQIEPRDAKLSTVDAKRVFRQYMLATKCLDKEEIGDHVGYFAEELKSQEQFLKEELARAKEDFGPDIGEAKSEIRKIERDIAKSTDSVIKAELEAELTDAKNELVEQSKYLEQAEREYREFKEDKRAFLVAYINQQTQR